jgi:uncharacterized protein YjeT (DUF2065 family)
MSAPPGSSINDARLADHKGMTRALVLQAGIGAVSGVAGLGLLLAPGAAGRVLRMAEGEPASYILRIAGMMLVALGLFLAGFATVFALASGGAA